MAKEKILVVEDEKDILELIEFNLQKEDYAVFTLSSGDGCTEAALQHRPDLILLDIMLPGVDGFEVCRKLKENSSTKGIPIIMLTAKGEDSDVITGLELGAEDYVTKPFSPKVLIARVRTVLRRSKNVQPTSKGVVEHEGLLIDPDRHEISLHGEPLELTHTEFRLLHLLVRNAGRVFTRDQIVKGVHGSDYPVTERSVDVQVVGLRKKLGAHGNWIETIRGVGYRYKE